MQMGMVMGLMSLSDANIERVLADPPLVWTVVAPHNPELYQRSRQGQLRPPGLIARWFGARVPASESDETAVEPLHLSEGEGDLGDLDKAWHGISYLLTGAAWEAPMPLGFLVAGGRAVGKEDVGYGPARAFTSAEVRDIARALERLSDEELERRFDPDAMTKAEIYPSMWHGDREDTLGYLLGHLETLREAVYAVVARGHGLLITLS